MSFRSRAAGLAAALAGSAGGASVRAQELVGQPTPGAMGLQTGVTELRDSAAFFHNAVLFPLIVGISLFVMALLLYVSVRFNSRRNPVPARFSHNTPIEIIWTVVPVVILMFVAVFSFRLLFAYHDMPKPWLTVKATGNQWNWTYEYPDQKVPEYTSSMLPEEEARARGVPYRLAADEPMVVPVNTNVRVLVTASDVLHAFAMPAFGVKTDAIPGRVNEVWFNARRPGVYYGQCSELCGVDHAFMPIQVNVVSQAEFTRWAATKGGGAPLEQPGLPAAVSGGTNAVVPAAVADAPPTAPPATVGNAASATPAPAASDRAAPATAGNAPPAQR
jgi:cytochrome c oxidase subunit 2